MANIITKKSEEKLNMFYDLDMTLQKHSNWKVNLHKILIPKFIEQKDSFYRKALTEVSNMGIYFSKPKIFEDVARIPIETYPFSTNRIFTKNSPKASNYFLNETDLVKYFENSITLYEKNPEIIETMLKGYQENPEESVAVLFGDMIGDLKNSYKGKVITVGFEGPLERNQEGLKNVSDIYILKETRENENLSRCLIYEGLEQKLDNFGISPKQRIRKEITSLKENYERILA